MALRCKFPGYASGWITKSWYKRQERICDMSSVSAIRVEIIIRQPGVRRVHSRQGTCGSELCISVPSQPARTRDRERQNCGITRIAGRHGTQVKFVQQAKGSPGRQVEEGGGPCFDCLRSKSDLVGQTLTR